MQLSKKIEQTRHYGLEFLTWMLFRSTKGDGVIETSSEKTEVWFEGKVRLVSPIATKEVDLLKGKTPAHSREAREALRQGKLLEEAGINLIRDEREWNLTFNATRWTFSGVKLPAVLQEEEDDRLIERFWLLEELHKAIEDLYTAFLEVRLDSTRWGPELNALQEWIGAEAEGDGY